MIISVNYQDNGAQYAMMTYCTFTKDGDQNINGVHVVKQVALVSSHFYLVSYPHKFLFLIGYYLF